MWREEELDRGSGERVPARRNSTWQLEGGLEMEALKKKASEDGQQAV